MARIGDKAPRRAARGARPGDEDTAMRSLSEEERAKLSMDAWEPSLLRHLLTAENRLRGQKKQKR